MKSMYAIFLAVSDRTTKNKILTATQKFIKKYPLARLNEREKIYFQKDFEYFVKSRIYEEYLLRKFMGHAFGITHREDVRQHQIIIRIFGVKITFSHKKDKI